MSQSSEIKKLQWQCRRGIKEVEVLLVPFFEAHYTQLDQNQRCVFERLLSCHDVDLFDWFTRRAMSEDPELSRLIDDILQSVGT